MSGLIYVEDIPPEHVGRLSGISLGVLKGILMLASIQGLEGTEGVTATTD